MRYEAVIQQIQGWLCVVCFTGQVPDEWKIEGGVLHISRDGDDDYFGVVLPLHNAAEVALRVEDGCEGLAVGETVSIQKLPDSVDYSQMSDYPNLSILSEYPEPEKTFSIFTLLRNEESYRRTLQSYRQFGFDETNTDFFAIDNRNKNLCDGYQGIRLGLSQATGRYVIFCHDDVELLQDDFTILCERLIELDRRFPNWMVAGIAGGLYRHAKRFKGRVRPAIRISDRFGVDRTMHAPFPRRVEALDECFLVMPRLRAAYPSIDLKGFHFYGTDLCSQAELAGGAAFIIDFHIFHHGNAQMGTEYFLQMKAFTKKYSSYYPDRRIITSTKPLVCAPSSSDQGQGQNKL